MGLTLIGGLAKGTAIYGVGQIVNRFLSLLILPLFTAYLTPKDYGVFSMLSLITLFAVPVFGLGLGTSLGVCYFQKESLEHRQATIWTGFVILASSCSFLLVFGLLFLNDLTEALLGSGEGHKRLVALSVVGAFFSVISQPFMSCFQFERRAKLFVLLTSMSNLILVGLTVFFIVFLGRSIAGWVEGTLIANIVSFCLYFFTANVSFSRFSRQKIQWSIGKELIKFGLPMIPSFAFLFIMQNGGRFFLKQFSSLDELGLFTVGHNFGLVVSVLANAFATAWFPYFMTFLHKQEEAKPIFGKVLTYYTLSFGFLTMMFFLFAKATVLLVLQEPFWSSCLVVGLIAWGYFVQFLAFIFMPGCYFVKKVYLCTLVQLGAAVVGTLLNFMLIPFLGMIGAAVAFCCCQVTFAFLLHFINKKMHLHAGNYEWGRLVKYGIIFAVFAIFSFVPRSFSFMGEVVFGGGLALLFGMLTLVLLSSEEIGFIRGNAVRLKKRLLASIGAHSEVSES